MGGVGERLTTTPGANQQMKKYKAVAYDVTAVQYDGSDASRQLLRELCGHWIMFSSSVPHVTTGRGLMQVRLMDWVTRCDDKDVYGFSVVPTGVFEKFYRLDETNNG